MKQKIKIYSTIKNMIQSAERYVEKGFTVETMNLVQSAYSQPCIVLKCDKTELHLMIGMPQFEESRKKHKNKKHKRSRV